MKLLICGLLLGTLSLFSAEPAEIKPLKPYVDEVIAEFHKESEDKMSFNQMAYVGRRCAALYSVMALFVSESAESFDDPDVSKTLDARAVTYMHVARMINKTQVKASEEFVTDQFQVLAMAYATMMKDNKILNNDLFPPFVRADTAAAMEIYPYFEAFMSEDE